MTFTVRYDESAIDGGKTEPNIGHSSITGIPMPYGNLKPHSENIETQQQFSPDNKENHMTASQPHTNAGISVILSYGQSSNQGKGWRAQQLRFRIETGHEAEDFEKCRRYPRTMGSVDGNIWIQQ